jgi:hypothetical protein
VMARPRLHNPMVSSGYNLLDVLYLLSIPMCVCGDE